MNGIERGEFVDLVILLLSCAACQPDPSPDLDRAVWLFMLELEGRKQGVL